MKKNTVFFIYIGIISCLVFISSATYALINDEDEIIVINQEEIKVQLLEAVYNDTSTIAIFNSRVGDSLSKAFSVKNLTDSDLFYNINFVDVANSFLNKDELVFSLKSETGAYVNQKVVPSNNETIASYIKIGKGQVHEYVLNIEFLNTQGNQFDNEYKTFFAKLNIVSSNDIPDYSDNSLFEIVKNSSYGNEGFIDNSSDISGGVFSTNSTTNGETIYFYRGSKSLNNNIVLGDNCYRMVRTTESFDIKAIYNGVVDENGSCNAKSVLVENSNQFNKNSNYNAYVGYMYGSASSNDYYNEHLNLSSSSIKIFLDSWYNTNLSSYNSYISNKGVFCSNRKTKAFNYNKIVFDNNGFGNSTSGYILFDKYINNNINLVCENENDRFSVILGYGNGELSNSIGLISIDELYYAGFFDKNTDNYLYSNESYWTMSPAYFYKGNAYNFVVNKNKVSQNIVSKESGIRPVIILKGETQVLSGDGSIGSPYVITK